MMKPGFLTGAIVILISVLLSVTCAAALEIEVLDLGPSSTDPEIFPLNSQELAAVDRAEQVWEDVFADEMDVTISLQLKVVNSPQLPPGTVQFVGQATSKHVTFETSIVKEALLVDAAIFQPQDRAIYEQLSDVIIPNFPPQAQFGVACRNSNQSLSVPALWYTVLTSANAKALALTAPGDVFISDNLPFPGLDAHIGITVRMGPGVNRDQLGQFVDYDQANGVPNLRTDFVALVAHEIGHALGFDSGIEPMAIQRALCIEDRSNLINRTVFPTLLDLFRFRPEATQFLSVPFRQLHFAPAEFFASNTDIRPEFARGNGGLTGIPTEADPNCELLLPAPHWRCTEQENGRQLLMNGSLERGIVTLKQTDARALDWIGYDDPTTFGSVGTMPGPIGIRAGAFQSDSAGLFPPGGKLPTKKQPVFPESPNRNLISGSLSIDWKFEEELKFEGSFVFETEKPNPEFVSAPRKETKAPLSHKIHEGAICLSGLHEPVSTKMLPARITEFFLRSTNEKGPRITLTAALPIHGLAYNPDLGEFGGYSISFLVDVQSQVDGDDVDGLVTLNLEADRKIDPSSILTQVNWKIGPGKNANRIRIKDFAAFGLRPPDTKQ